jgi:hypothetical protein
VRIYHDAINWLEGQQNYLGEYDDEWTLRLEASEDTTCTVYYGGSSIYNDAVNDSSYVDIEITPEYNKLINVSCNNATSIMTLIDGKDINIFSREFDDEDDDYDYTIRANEVAPGDRFRIPPPCWSATSKWRYCNTQVTLYSLIADIDDDQKEVAAEWMENHLANGSIVGKYVSTNDKYFDTALYLYAVDHDSTPVLEWLVYSQNNDGSWGAGTSTQSRVASTAMTILGLANKTFTSSQEVLTDARGWMSVSNPYEGWSTTVDDALSFMILKDNARPFLKVARESPLEVSKKTDMLLFNPTSYDISKITYSIYGAAKNALTVSGTSSIAAYDNGSMTIAPKEAKAGRYVGVIAVKDAVRTLLLLPVVYEQSIYLDVEPATTIYTFDGEGRFALQVKDVNADFSCEIDWQDGMSSSPFTLRKTGMTHVQVQTTLNMSMAVNGTLVCRNNEFSSITPFQAEVELYDHPPLKIKPNSLKVKRAGENTSLSIENLMDSSTAVDIGFAQSQYNFIIKETSLTLAPNEEREVLIVNRVLEGENITIDTQILVEAHGREVQVPFVVDIVYAPGRGKFWIMLFVWLIILGVLGGGGYFVFMNRTKVFGVVGTDYMKVKDKLPGKLQKFLPMTKQEKEEKLRTERKEKKERNYYEELVSIMKSLEKSDQEVSERLHSEGLSDGEIERVLADFESDQKVERSIKHEEDVLGLIKDISDPTGDIFKKLRDEGYSQEQLQEALSELSHDVEDKEKLLKKKAGKEDEEPGEEKPS